MNLDDFKHLLSHLDIRAESKRPLEATEDANLRRFKDKWLFLGMHRIQRSRSAPNRRPKRGLVAQLVRAPH